MIRVFVFEGWIKAPESGVYTFKMDTDDGSQLYIDDYLVIDNNYNRGNIVTTGFAYLEKGLHKFRMPYFEGHNDEKIDLGWRTPGTNSFVTIPAEVFYPAN